MPLAEAVVFAMLASYVLSRTLVPTLAKYWLQKHDPHARPDGAWFPQQLQLAFERGFERTCASVIVRALSAPSPPADALPCLPGRHGAHRAVGVPFGRYLPGLGQDFFPRVDARPDRLHVRAPTGARIDETATLCDRVEASHPRGHSGRARSSTIVDNIGMPYSGINLAYCSSAPVGSRTRTSLSNLDGESPPDGSVRAPAAQAS